MENIYGLMNNIYNICNKVDRRYIEVRPKWKEHSNINYKYYYMNPIHVQFNLEKKILRLSCQVDKLVDQYEIDYPRFTCQGNMQDPKYFNFYFSVREQGKSGVIILRADKITNLAEMYESKLNISLEARENFLSQEDIVGYQDEIYASLGLGIGLDGLKIKNEELDRLKISREEFDYGARELIIRAENFNLINRLRSLGIKEETYLDIIQKLVESKLELEDLRSKLMIRYEISDLDYQALVRVAGLKLKNMDRKRELVKLMDNKFDQLDLLVDRLEKLIYLGEIESLGQDFNVGQTLRNHGYSVGDIDICKTTTQLICRTGPTGLSIIEMLALILNYKRPLVSSLKLEEIRRGSKIGTLVL